MIALLNGRGSVALGIDRSPEERLAIRRLFAFTAAFFIIIGGPQADGDFGRGSVMLRILL